MSGLASSTRLAHNTICFSLAGALDNDQIPAYGIRDSARDYESGSSVSVRGLSAAEIGKEDTVSMSFEAEEQLLLSKTRGLSLIGFKHLRKTVRYSPPGEKKVEPDFFSLGDARSSRHEVSQ